jgi:Fe-S oxidoreductase
MIGKINAGLFNAAYKVLLNFAVLPGIVCHICDEPCKKACVREEVDTPVSVRELEMFCWLQRRGKTTELFFIPEKKKRVLIAGGGLLGISCAVKLAGRGYITELAEKSGRLGGRVWELVGGNMPADVLEEEFAALSRLKYLTIMTGKEVSHLNKSGYDALLVTYQTPEADESFYNDGVFYAQHRFEANPAPLAAIRRGVSLSYVIEDYVNKGVTRQPEENKLICKYRPSIETISRVVQASPTKASEWTVDDAKLEAGRCILCSCDNCLGVCEMLSWHSLSAKKLMINISDTINKMRWTKRTGIRPSMSCTQCGLCEKECPAGINLKQLCLETRRELRETKALPDGYYDYWLNDMEHANGENAALFVSRDAGKCEYVYFPGCQAGASDPEYVLRSYEWLCENVTEKTALSLRCCGAPAYWAGNKTSYKETLSKIIADWNESQEAVFILSCPNCIQMLKNNAPEIKTISIWDIMAEFITEQSRRYSGTVSVFDPCASKYDRKTQQSVRELIRSAGYEIKELESAWEGARCCGYGGLVYSSNPGLAERIASHNIELGELEFITYCSNCRDSFVGHKKPSRHVFDILFFDDNSRNTREPPNLTRRRENRVILKKKILSVTKGLKFEAEMEPFDDIKLIISDQMMDKLNRKLIHEDNIKQLIYNARESGKYLYCEEDDTYTAHQQQGKVTFWAQYKPVEGGFLLLNAYLHRLQIEEVWYG